MHLLLLRTPFAVARFIVSIVVDAVKRMSIRGWHPHVLDKTVNILPTCANRNAASTITAVGSFFRICASSPHLFPYAVQRVIGHAVRPIHLRGNILLQTPATFCVTPPEDGANNNFFVPTITLTMPPPRWFRNIAHKADNNQSPETPAGQVLELYVGGKWDVFDGKLSVSHCKNLLNRFEFWLGSFGRLNRTFDPFFIIP